MFSKLTVLVYCLPAIVFIINHEFSHFWIKICLVSFYTLALIVLSMKSLFKVDIVVESGKAPVERLPIAYKFVPPGISEHKLNFELQKCFPKLQKIYFYYSTSDMVHLGCACGVILNDDIVNDKNKKKVLSKRGFRFFHTPPVSHAVFTSYPVFSWFPITYWLAITRTYPEIHRYCEKHNLSAYPMVEIHDRKSVLFFAPLSRQDSFVVPEAEDTIMRAKIKLEELEEEASGSEGNSRESEAESERVSIGSSCSQSTGSWSFYSSHEKISDDETLSCIAEEDTDKNENIFRRSMSRCVRTVKSILGHDSNDPLTKEDSFSSDSTLTGNEAVGPSQDQLKDLKEFSDDEGISDMHEEKSISFDRNSFRRSMSKVANLFRHVTGSSKEPDVVCCENFNTIKPLDNTVNTNSLTTELRLEINPAENPINVGGCSPNSFQVPTVSFVGA